MHDAPPITPMRARLACAGLALIGLAPVGHALAQQPAFTTPGMPVRSAAAGDASGQTDRFTNTFNPAIGAVLDAVLDWVDPDAGEEGFDAEVRSFELTFNGRVDPSWWAYATVVATEEEIEAEEATAHFTGLDSNTTLRFGRFFVDFGKQMQAHTHDLPYPDRPGVLSAYLGDELPGVGAEVDHWWATGDASALRASFGLFADLEAGHAHGEDEAGEGVEQTFAERQDLDALALTARVTQFMDVGERGVFQWGLSARHLPEFGYVDEVNMLEATDLSNTVYGLDLTYGIDSEDGLAGWTFGGELLVQSGDLSAEADTGLTELEVFDDDVAGFYVWGERRFDARQSAGVLFSSFEHPEPGAPSEDEVTAYTTRNMSEFARLRFAASQLWSDEDGDSTRLLVQLTTYFGPHAHGVNW
jgi:hypothetical protein